MKRQLGTSCPEKESEKKKHSQCGWKCFFNLTLSKEEKKKDASDIKKKLRFVERWDW